MIELHLVTCGNLDDFERIGRAELHDFCPVNVITKTCVARARVTLIGGPCAVSAAVAQSQAGGGSVDDFDFG